MSIPNPNSAGTDALPPEDNNKPSLFNDLSKAMSDIEAMEEKYVMFYALSLHCHT